MIGAFLHKRSWSLLLCCLILSFQKTTGQIYVLSDSSKISISGTSTLHDWQMNVTRFDGTFEISEEKGMKALNSLRFEAETLGLTSKKSGMQRDAHEALGAEDFPVIRFAQDQSFPIGGGEEGVSPSEVLLSGILSIRGHDESSEIPVRVEWLAETVLMRGSVVLDMTTFGVDPPKAMLGLIRTGEEVVVDFDLIWKADQK